MKKYRTTENVVEIWVECWNRKVDLKFYQTLAENFCQILISEERNPSIPFYPSRGSQCHTLNSWKGQQVPLIRESRSQAFEMSWSKTNRI